MKVSQEQFTEAISPRIDDRVLLDLSYSDAWCLLGTLQLALRNPDLPATIHTAMLSLTNVLIAEIVPPTILTHIEKEKNIRSLARSKG